MHSLQQLALKNLKLNVLFKKANYIYTNNLNK